MYVIILCINLLGTESWWFGFDIEYEADSRDVGTFGEWLGDV